MRIVLLQLFFILASAEEEEIICPKNIKTFAFDSDSTKFYYCPEEGDYAVVKTCPGGGNYKSVIGDCVGGNEVENDEDIKSRKNVAKSRMMVAEKDVNQQNSKNKLEGDDRLKNNQAPAKDIHQQPSMGRHVTLGALYYGKTDRIANDENFWTVNSLIKNKIIENIGSSSTKIAVTQTITERMKAFGLDASFSMSFLGGNFGVTVQGSAEFLNHKRDKEESVSVSFFYESVERVEYITQDMRRTLDFPEVCSYALENDNPPTHVVSSITYGFRGIFDFQKATENATQNQKAGMSLKVGLNLGIAAAEGEGYLNLTDKATYWSDQVTCKFEGDAILESAPTTYREALQVYKKFPALAKETGNVIYFSLSPITKYCGDEFMTLLNEIQPNLIERVLEIVEEMENTERMINSLKDLDTVKLYSNTIGQMFYEYHQEFKAFEWQWKSELGVIYRKTGGYSPNHDDLLANHTRKYENSKFEAKNCKCFLDNRQREIQTVRSIIYLIPEIVREEMGDGKGNKCRFTYPTTFEYQLYILPDPNKKRNRECEIKETWSDVQIMKAGALYKRFVDFVEQNKKKKNHCFLVSMKKMNTTTNSTNQENPARIDLMHKGDSQLNDFFPPMKVPLPEKLDVFRDRIEFVVPYANVSNSTQVKQTNLLMVSIILM